MTLGQRDMPLIVMAGPWLGPKAPPRTGSGRPSMYFLDVRGKGVDGRAKPCHDVWGTGASFMATPGNQSGFTPSLPARSWMNCQATRPEREPRVIDHSTAWAWSASVAIGSAMLAA